MIPDGACSVEISLRRERITKLASPNFFLFPRFEFSQPNSETKFRRQSSRPHIASFFWDPTAGCSIHKPYISSIHAFVSCHCHPCRPLFPAFILVVARSVTCRSSHLHFAKVVSVIRHLRYPTYRNPCSKPNVDLFPGSVASVSVFNHISHNFLLLPFIAQTQIVIPSCFLQYSPVIILHR